jgi:hypothetical protein
MKVNFAKCTLYSPVFWRDLPWPGAPEQTGAVGFNKIPPSALHAYRARLHKIIYCIYCMYVETFLENMNTERGGGRHSRILEYLQRIMFA